MGKWVNHYEWLCFSAHLISLFHWTLFISAADATVAEITSTLSRNSLCNTRPDSQQARKNCLRISASFYFTKGRFNDGGKDRDTHTKHFPRPRTLIWQAWQYLTLQLSLPCPGRQRCPATPGPRLSSRALGSFVPAALLGPPGASILSVMGGHVPSPKQHFLYSLQGLLKRGLMFTFPIQC